MSDVSEFELDRRTRKYHECLKTPKQTIFSLSMMSLNRSFGILEIDILLFIYICIHFTSIQYNNMNILSALKKVGQILDLVLIPL
jgi:hypothetical protein